MGNIFNRLGRIDTLRYKNQVMAMNIHNISDIKITNVIYAMWLPINIGSIKSCLVAGEILIGRIEYFGCTI